MKAPFPNIGAWRRRKDIFTNHNWITELINHEAVYRTAPATPGLLIRANSALQSKSNDGFAKGLQRDFTKG